MPVGLGNNAADYDTSILLSQDRDDESIDAEASDSDGVKEATDDQEIENDKASDTKVLKKGKATVKKEAVVPAKRVKSQVDRLADVEVAQWECKRAKYETEGERFRTFATMASVKAKEKSHRLVEIEQAKLKLEQDKLRMEHEYQMGVLNRGQVLLPPSQDGIQSYSTTWNQAPFTSSQPFASPQPFAGSQPFAGLQPFTGLPPSTSSQPSTSPQPSTSSQPFTSSQPLNSSPPFPQSSPQPFSDSASSQLSIGFKVPALESFPLPTSQDHSDSEHHGSPLSGKDVLDESTS